MNVEGYYRLEVKYDYEIIIRQPFPRQGEKISYRIFHYFRRRIRIAIDERDFTSLKRIFSSETEFYLICSNGKKIISIKKEVDAILQTYFDELFKSFNANNYVGVAYREKLRAFLNSLLKIRPEFFL